MTCPLTTTSSQTTTSLWNKRIQISSYHFTKVGFFKIFFKRVFLVVWKIRFPSRPLLMHDLRGNYVLSLNKLEKPVVVFTSSFFLPKCWMMNALPRFAYSLFQRFPVPLSLLLVFSIPEIPAYLLYCFEFSCFFRWSSVPCERSSGSTDGLCSFTYWLWCFTNRRICPGKRTVGK